MNKDTSLIDIHVVSTIINERVYLGIIDLRDYTGSNLARLYSNNNNIWRGLVSVNNHAYYVIIDPNSGRPLQPYLNFVEGQIRRLELDENLGEDIRIKELWGYGFPSPSRPTWLDLISTHDIIILTGVEQRIHIIPTTYNIEFLSLGCICYMVASPWPFIRLL